MKSGRNNNSLLRKRKYSEDTNSLKNQNVDYESKKCSDIDYDSEYKYIRTADTLKNNKTKKENEKKLPIQMKKREQNWLPSQDQLLINLCNSNLKGSWKKISVIIGNKTPNQCSYRYKKLEETGRINNSVRTLDNKLILKNDVNQFNKLSDLNLIDSRDDIIINNNLQFNSSEELNNQINQFQLVNNPCNENDEDDLNVTLTESTNSVKDLKDGNNSCNTVVFSNMTEINTASTKFLNNVNEYYEFNPCEMQTKKFNEFKEFFNQTFNPCIKTLDSTCEENDLYFNTNNKLNCNKYIVNNDKDKDLDYLKEVEYNIKNNYVDDSENYLIMLDYYKQLHYISLKHKTDPEFNEVCLNVQCLIIEKLIQFTKGKLEIL